MARMVQLKVHCTIYIMSGYLANCVVVICIGICTGHAQGASDGDTGSHSCTLLQKSISQHRNAARELQMLLPNVYKSASMHLFCGLMDQSALPPNGGCVLIIIMSLTA